MSVPRQCRNSCHSATTQIPIKAMMALEVWLECAAQWQWHVLEKRVTIDRSIWQKVWTNTMRMSNHICNRTDSLHPLSMYKYPNKRHHQEPISVTLKRSCWNQILSTSLSFPVQETKMKKCVHMELKMLTHNKNAHQHTSITQSCHALGLSSKFSAPVWMKFETAVDSFTFLSLFLSSSFSYTGI